MKNINFIEFNKAPILFPFQRAVAKDIQEICRPLFEQLNICFFSHTRHFHHGGFTSLMSNVDVTEYYLNNQHRIHFNTGHGYTLKDGYYIAAHLRCPFSQKGISDLRQRFNLDHLLYVIEKQRDYDDMYAFATTPDNTSIINTYLNEMSIIQHFIWYYKDKSKYLIQKTDVIRYSHDFFIKETVTQNTIDLDIITDSVIKEMPLKKVPIHGYRGEALISQRELECWRYLLSDCSLKEIARGLNLSCRTVETYLNNLKNKVGCYSNKHLMKLARELKLTVIKK